MRNYSITMYPSIGGKRKKITQVAKGSNRKNARRNARENVREEYGSNMW